MTRSEAMKIWLKHADEHKEQGKSEIEVAVSMGCSSLTEYRTTRARYKNHLRTDGLAEVVETLRTNVDEHKFVDVGKGASLLLGVSQDRLRVALAALWEEGYVIHTVLAEQQNPESGFSRTAVKVLTSPGTTFSEVASQKNLISPITTKKEESE